MSNKKIGKFPFRGLGKAMAIGETDGFVKILADENLEQNGQIASLCFKKNEVTGEYFKTPKRF